MVPWEVQPGDLGRVVVKAKAAQVRNEGLPAASEFRTRCEEPCGLGSSQTALSCLVY